jgi:hypothetical protein
MDKSGKRVRPLRSIYRQFIGAKAWKHTADALVIKPRREGRGMMPNGKRTTLQVEQQRTVLLHNLQALDNDLGARSDQDLALAGLLSVVDAVEGIVEDGRPDHVGGYRVRFSNRKENVRREVSVAEGKGKSVMRRLEHGECSPADGARRVLPARF